MTASFILLQRGQGFAAVNPEQVVSVEALPSGSEVRLNLRGGHTLFVQAPASDFTTDPVEAVCRALLGMDECDGSHGEAMQRDVGQR